MPRLSSAFPLGLFVNESNTLDENLLKSKIDFMLVKVSGVPGVSEWDRNYEKNVDLAYRLGIPCGLVIYLDPALIDKNWPLDDFSRWGKGPNDPIFGKHVGSFHTKKFDFIVLYYHTSRMKENGLPIEPQWLSRIPVYEAEQFHNEFFGPTKNLPLQQRRVLIAASEEAMKLVSDPDTYWKEWPFMSVVEAFSAGVTWDNVRAKINEVDADAITPSGFRPLWNFDPLPTHNLPGTGNAGLVTYLGTKESLHKWCKFTPAGSVPSDPPVDPPVDPPADPPVDPPSSSDLVAALQKLDGSVRELIGISKPFFDRFK